MKRIKINVTQDDIKKGARRDGNNCPVARAIKRQVKGSHVFVGGIDIDIDLDDNFSFCFTSPAKVNNFIERFDDKESVKPFSFVLKYDL